MTRNRLKGQMTGVHNVDLFEIFPLRFENMNCSFGSQESPSSVGGLVSVTIIFFHYWRKTRYDSTFLVSIVEEIRQRSANQPEFILNHAGVYLVL